MISRYERNATVTIDLLPMRPEGEERKEEELAIELYAKYFNELVAKGVTEQDAQVVAKIILFGR